MDWPYMCSPSQWGTLKNSITCRLADILMFVGCSNSWHLREHTCNEKKIQTGNHLHQYGEMSLFQQRQMQEFQPSKIARASHAGCRQSSTEPSAPVSNIQRVIGESFQVHPSTGWNSNGQPKCQKPSHSYYPYTSSCWWIWHWCAVGKCCQRVGSKIFSNGMTHP
jgi:hypothetical protein